ncbi:hypothetical protein [Tropicimonas marinistellae]|uniref:hypothetical protein n=1 Tax=Tropicimonas marinistellae TaxID=1739787 RepID=UPI000831FCE5|nr:hypothetical protein [Tropicimonas marinistellae]
MEFLLRRVLSLPGNPVEPAAPVPEPQATSARPEFTIHVIVFNGARPVFHGAPNLAHMIKAECALAGITERCLITTSDGPSPCHPQPVAAVYPRGDWYSIPDRRAARRLVSEVLCDSQPLPKFHLNAL